MWGTMPRARLMARKYPILGAYIARIELPDGDEPLVEKTLGREHYTVWGEPHALLESVAKLFTVPR